jgi:beta-glucosidase
MTITLFLAALILSPSALAAPGQTDLDLAYGKKYVCSDPNTQGWNGGLTDGIWKTERGPTFATGASPDFPKTVTLDLESPATLGYISVGVPPFGATKTVAVSLSTDGTSYAEVGRYVFSPRKEEKHLFQFPPAVARYLRLTYLDHYDETINYPPPYTFTTDVGAYAPNAIVYPPVQGLEAANQPAPKIGPDGLMNANFAAQHTAFLQRIKGGPIGLLFIGDSITNRWRNDNVRDLWQRFEKYQPANFGIEGDRTQHVLWRFENGELDGIAPKVVVVMIGTNNMRDYPAEDIIRGDTEIVAEIHRRLPDTKVLLLGIFPRGARASDPARAKIKVINAELAKLDDGNKTHFLDLGDRFLDAEGNLTPEMAPDALHPTRLGYQIWADALQPLLDKMMR